MNARLYGRLQTALGWSREEIDGKTFDEVDDLIGYWRQSPPAAELLQYVAAAHGWKPNGGGGEASGPMLSEEEMQVLSRITYEEP